MMILSYVMKRVRLLALPFFMPASGYLKMKLRYDDTKIRAVANCG